MRDYRNFYGFLIPTATDNRTGLTLTDFFTCLGRFELFNDRLILEFPDWVNASAFDEFKQPLGVFTKIYQLSGEQFENFKDTSPVVSQIIETARTLAKAPADAEFRLIRISAKDYTLSIRFYKNGQAYIFEQDSATYNQTIQENLGLAASAIQTAMSIAFEQDVDYWTGATQVLPE